MRQELEGWTRTSDLRIIIPVLYHLSYSLYLVGDELVTSASDLVLLTSACGIRTHDWLLAR